MAARLIIYDDLFPSLRSGFRLAELGAYLDSFPEARVTVSNLSGRRSFETRLDQYRSLRPEHVGRILFGVDVPGLTHEDFIYAIFLNNAVDVLALSEANGTPFGFELYPGGGFSLENAESDAKLERVLRSPLFTFVIVTQPRARDYVATKFRLGPDRLHLLGPGPVWSSAGSRQVPERRFRPEKKSFDVGFIAHKYGADLRTKGYDFFVEVARLLARSCDFARFHVVGGYSPSDCSLHGMEDRFTFFGSLDAPEFERVCRSLDVVVSPNVPAGAGTFDGFPTASCSQAALEGVVVHAADPLNLNTHLVAGRDFLLLERDSTSIRPEDAVRAAETLRELAFDPQRLALLSRQTRIAFDRLLGFEAQLAPRIALLRSALAGELRPIGGDGGAWESTARQAQRRALRERAELVRLESVVAEAQAYIAEKDAYQSKLLERVAELERALEASKAAGGDRSRGLRRLRWPR